MATTKKTTTTKAKTAEVKETTNEIAPPKTGHCGDNRVYSSSS